MRITRRPSLPGTTAADNAGAVAPSAAPPPRADEGAGPDDTVNLSDAARLRQRLRADLGDARRTDPARVASLHAAVAGGTYAPAADAVARSLVGELATNLLV
ncbi:MAG TPA: flagellar biosynthesis anti-sigma factor FlgM [Candidatus Binatia bacterium]